MSSNDPLRRLAVAMVCCPHLVVLAGCKQKMSEQPRAETYEKAEFFSDQVSARSLAEGAIPRGHMPQETELHTGKRDGTFVNGFPMRLNEQLLLRGRDRFNAFCAPCHDRAGTGRGIVVQRGFRAPESFHTARLRDLSEGYLFDVVTSGFGRMPAFSTQLGLRDRWAVVAYVRALQLSQNATLADVPAESRATLETRSP